MDLSELLDLAVPAVQQRGTVYFAEDRVRVIEARDNLVRAKVRGTETYSCRLERVEGEWRYGCACPAADDGSFCKHLVAVALAVGSPDAEPMQDELEAFLHAQPAARLAGWLMEFADTDREIDRQLRFFMASRVPKTLKKALSKLIGSPRFLDWRQSMDYARRLDPALTALEELLTDDPAECLALCDYSVRRLLRIYERVDDSSGSIGDQVRAFAELHARACEYGASGGKALARELYRSQQEDQWALFPLANYWEALGEAGQAEYGRLVIDALDGLPAESHKRSDGDTFYVLSRAEDHARQSRDFELLQRVLRRDLDSSYAHLKVIESLREFGRDAEALQWAERAVKRFPRDTRVREQLILALSEAGLDNEAREHAWEAFRLRPVSDNWDLLKQHAGAGWKALRQRALEEVARRALSTRDGRRDASVEVELLLHDGDFGAAVVLAESNAVEPDLLLRLAKRLETEQPVTAGNFYRRVADFETERLEPRQYARFADCVANAAGLLPNEESTPWLRKVKEKHRRKTKLMSLFEKRGL